MREKELTPEESKEWDRLLKAYYDYQAALLNYQIKEFDNNESNKSNNVVKSNQASTFVSQSERDASTFA